MTTSEHARAALSPAGRRLLEQRLGGSGRPVRIPRVEPRSEVSALSAAQQRLYFLDQLEPGSTEYLMPAAWRLTGPLDVPALAAAVADLTERHAQLRVVFPALDGVPGQRVWPEGAPLVVVDVQDSDVPATVTDLASRPFDLAAEPGFRATLLRVGPTDHVLVLAVHHIVCDGWSFGIIVHDLALMYRARATGTPADLQPTAIDYIDYALWQRDQEQSPERSLDLDHWRTVLADLSPLRLPTDFERPELRSHVGAVHSVTLPHDLTERLAAVGRRTDTTPAMVLLAAFQAALAFHSGQDDITIGTIVANRDRPETEQLVGFFVNTLLIRVHLADNPSLTELLARTRDHLLGALSHQGLPFERIVEELAPARDLSRNPLFQVLYAYEQDDEGGPLVLTSSEGEAVGVGLDIDLTTAKFDLSLHARRVGDRFRLAFNYRPDLFAATSVARLADHTVAVLKAFTGEPDARLGDLDLLTTDERAVLTPPIAPYRPGETAPVRFARHVRASPDAVAVTDGARSLTYAELDARSAVLAGVLRGHGATRETLVGVCLTRSVDLAVAILGIWRAGAAYLPLDPTYPRARLEYLIGDAGVDLAVTDTAGADILAGFALRTVDVTSDVTVTGSSPTVPSSTVDNGPDDLAYVIYTSGSTGQPKGVEITHGNLAWLFDAADRHFDFGPADVWTLAHSYAFDFSVWELWGPLTSGGRVVVLSGGQTRDPAAMHAALVEHAVTVLNQTPAAFAGLRAHLARHGHDVADLALRTVIFGGDALDVRDYRDWFTGARRPALVNMYGITETTVHVTFRPITAADTTGIESSPIGRPLTGQYGLVLDRHGRQVPIGTVGELFVGGAGVARGYRDRPELTAQRFPIDPESGERRYRSGDLVRVRPDGELAYVGRIDQQVKIRGFRIEPGEIESGLRGCPGVRDAAVVARADRHGTARLVAHLVLDDGRHLDPTALRARLRVHLPEHMVPAVFVAHPELPVTPNGKVDRAALLDAGTVGEDRGRRYVPPCTYAESLLAKVWAEVLEVERVGAQDNFFDRGGDSILALRVVGLSGSAGLAFTVADLFQTRTLADLAAVATDVRPGHEPRVTAPFALLDPADVDRLPEGLADAYPLTRLQAGMLHELLADPERGAYHNVTNLKLTIPEGFDLAAFQSAVDTVVAAHEVLRASVDLAAHGEPVMLVHRTASLPVGYTDLRDVPIDERRALLRRFVADEFAHRFDLTAAPLVRIHLHQISTTELRITVTDCHIVLDGWSLTSLVADLLELHRQAVVRRSRPTLPAPPPLAEYVALERAAVADEAARAWWRDMLRDLSPIRFPPRGGHGCAYEVRRSFHELAGDIARVAGQAGVPHRTVLLAVFYHVMGVFAEPGVRHAIGVVHNGRPELPGADRMRGMFLNTVPFGVRAPGVTWLDLLRAGFAREQDMMPHRRVPLAVLAPDWTGSAEPVEAVFNYVNFHRLSYDSWDESLEIARTAFPLACNANPGGFTLDADPSRLDEATVEAIADLMRDAIDALVADPSAPVTWPVPAGTARQRALGEWAMGPVLPTDGVLFHEVVAAHAARTPDAIAVGFTDRRITYAELDRAADLLAGQLVDLGIGPGTIAGICVERGPSQVLAVLAVLKAGGAYLPLDPGYPTERLAFMATDSDMRVLLTEDALAGIVPFDGPIVRLGRPMPDGTGRPAARIGPDDLAYVIYTSGSTGRPKAVAVSHRGLTNLVAAQRDVLRATPADRVLQFASFSFDAWVFELAWALGSGAELRCAPADDLRAGPELAHTLRIHGVTAAVLPPTVLGVLAGESLPALATLMAAGEACPADLVDAWASGRRFLNGYGLTETSVWTNTAECTPGDPRPPIGRPIRNTRVYVLDADLRPVPVGVPGEVCVGGDALANSYLGRPALTAQRFVPDPYGPPGTRLFRTGDIGRHRADGTLEHLGRADNQVKLRGLRVELGEIEAALRALESVRDAAVLLRDDLPGGPALVGYVVPAQDTEPLRRALRERLPAHMVPGRFMFVDALPLTGNGKVDRRALPAPMGVSAAYVPPTTATEVVLTDVWRTVLGVPDVGVHDDFFELGGNSLATVRVTALAAARGVAVTVRDLVEVPTVARLAARVAGGSTDDVGGEVRSLVELRAGAGTPLHCVHPTGGSAAWYVPLARALAPGRPVRAFQARGLFGGTDPTTVAGIAANYVAELVDPGPHPLLGWSMGGNVALEMATQLHDAGHQVMPLVLVEPFLPQPAARQRLIRFIRDLSAARVIRDRARALPSGSSRRDTLVAELRALLLGAGLTVAEADLTVDAPVQVWHSLLAALADYSPRPYPGHIHLVIGRTAADLPPDQPIPGVDVGRAEYLARWRELALGGLTVHLVPGDHRTMLTEPLVRHVATLLEELWPV